MLIATIILSVVFMFVLPLVLALTLTRRYHATWRTVGVGVLAYLVTQSVMLLLVEGVQAWLQNQLSNVIAGLSLTTILLYALAWLACIFTVISLWIGQRYLKNEADSWIGALTLGVGFSSAECLLMGVQMVYNFYPYVGAALFGVQSLGLSTSDATTLASSLGAFLSTPWYLPLTYILDRLAYVSVYLAVAVVVWQALAKRKRAWLWLAGGIVWLIIVQTLNNVVATISVDSYWTELFLFTAMLISLEFLYWYKVNVLDKQARDEATPEAAEVIEVDPATNNETVEPTGGARPRKPGKTK